jgi:hypothetical protein
MDINKLTVEEREKLMKEGKCFQCRKQGHLSRDCPGTGNGNGEKKTTMTPPKKWNSKDAGVHIRALIAAMDEDEKKKLMESAEEEGLGF